MTTHLHFGLAIRYVELNPVRAGMVQRAEAYSWSSTRGRCGLRVDPLIAPLVLNYEKASSWSEWLNMDMGEDEQHSVRQSTRTGLPLGSEEFVEELEQQLGRRLKPSKGGRPKRQRQETNQGETRLVQRRLIATQ
jgi:putative transposase